MDPRPFERVKSTTLPPPAPTVERRQVMTGRIDKDSIKLVIDTCFEHHYAFEWQGEVVSRG